MVRRTLNVFCTDGNSLPFRLPSSDSRCTRAFCDSRPARTGQLQTATC